MILRGVRKAVLFVTVFVIVTSIIFSGLLLNTAPGYAQEEAVVVETVPDLELTRAEIKQLIEPSVVRVIQHIEGNVEVIPFELDLVNLKIVPADANAVWEKVPLDKYIIGNGVVINEDGFVLINAHLASPRSARITIAAPVAEALFNDALKKLTDEQLEAISAQEIAPERSAAFSEEIIEYIITRSKFPAAASVNVISPAQAGDGFFALSSNGIFAISAYAHNNYQFDKYDYAIINTEVRDPKPLPVASLASSTEVYMMQYPSVTDADTKLIYDGVLVKGIVREDLFDITYPHIYYIETERPMEISDGLGPLFNDTGQIVGIISRPDTRQGSTGTVFSVVHTEAIIAKLNQINVRDFMTSDYRLQMLSYFDALGDGDSEAADALLQEMNGATLGGADSGGGETSEPVVETAPIVGPVNDSQSLWVQIVELLKKPFASFSVNVSDVDERDPLNMILIVGGSILAFVLLIVIIWVLFKLKNHRLQHEENMKDVSSANAIPSGEFGLKTKKNTPAQQQYLKEGVRTMHRDTSVSDGMDPSIPSVPVPTTTEVDNSAADIDVDEVEDIAVPTKKVAVNPEAPIPTNAPVATQVKNVEAPHPVGVTQDATSEKSETIAPQLQKSVSVGTMQSVPTAQGDDKEKIATMWPNKYADTTRGTETPTGPPKEVHAAPDTKKQALGTPQIYAEMNAYIKDTLAGGFKEEEITNSLIAAGWREADIRDSFTLIKKV